MKFLTEKCSIELALADDSIKHDLGKVNDVMVELHMTFVPIDFVPIILETFSSYYRCHH